MEWVGAWGKGTWSGCRDYVVKDRVKVSSVGIKVQGPECRG